MRLLYLMPLLLCVASLSANSWAERWELSTDESHLNFITTKALHVSERNTFDRIHGTVEAMGSVQLIIELDSVNTGISIRDQRVRDLLFRTMIFGTATIRANVDLPRYTELPVGESLITNKKIEIDLNGRKVGVVVDLLVSKLGENKIAVLNRSPLILTGSQFGLVDGIEKLRELAGLPSIGYTVPVTSYLVFRKKP